MISTSAPKAFIKPIFSFPNTSAVINLKRYPFIPHTKANPAPVLPPEYSTTVIPGFKTPLFSAPSIIESAILSFFEPVGLYASNLTYILPQPFGRIF